MSSLVSAVVIVLDRIGLQEIRQSKKQRIVNKIYTMRATKDGFLEEVKTFQNPELLFRKICKVSADWLERVSFAFNMVLILAEAFLFFSNAW